MKRACFIGLGLAALLFTGYAAQAQKRCKGDRKWFKGKCRYPDKITKLKRASKPRRPKKRRPIRSVAGLVWVTIPAGKFMMGSITGGNDERPLRFKKVRAFDMLKSEVTVTQYRACVSAGSCTRPGTDGQCNWSHHGRGRHPVNCVDWKQARDYCSWAGGRLPSETQWEFAAGGGGKDWKYPWGAADATCSRAIIGLSTSCTSSRPCGCGKNHTWPVCSRPAGNSLHGLCDMAGNVWEWVEDCWHKTYRGSPTDGRAWTKNCVGSNRVSRSGSWEYATSFHRVAYRNNNPPGNRDDDMGIRCVRQPASGALNPTQPGMVRKPGVRWVAIPGGSFTMGSSTGDSDEKPAHRVTVRSFSMLKTEVTVAQYRACVSAGSCTRPQKQSRCNWGVSGRDAHPVTCVSWNQAKKFCKWVGGGRLPSEAEWEYAARGGGRDWKYPWGNGSATCARAVMDDKATTGTAGTNTDGCGTIGTFAVCSRTSGNTAHGLCDMAGNAWEWVEDCWHTNYAGAPSNGSAWKGNCANANMTMRGGNHSSAAKAVRTTYRSYNKPDYYLGFRCAR